MKLVASVMVAPGELDRYLPEAIGSLLEFCDAVVARCEGEPEYDYLTTLDGVDVWMPVDASFFDHEGYARQELLVTTLDKDPTHVLAIDADELVDDGPAVRRELSRDDVSGAWDLCMQEVWNTYPDRLEIRQDGGWVEHGVPCLWKPHALPQPLRIPDRALACGRVPQAALAAPRGCVDTAILHFGWANTSEREKRHARYTKHDGGRYHASAHLNSILLPDDRISILSRPWPETWPPALVDALRRRSSGNGVRPCEIGQLHSTLRIPTFTCPECGEGPCPRGPS